MRDVELYQQIFGLSSPWKVERVELDTEGQKVEVFVSHGEGTRWKCPHCEGVTERGREGEYRQGDCTITYLPNRTSSR